jgi:hypothetical protein
VKEDGGYERKGRFKRTGSDGGCNVRKQVWTEKYIQQHDAHKVTLPFGEICSIKKNGARQEKDERRNLKAFLWRTNGTKQAHTASCGGGGLAVGAGIGGSETAFLSAPSRKTAYEWGECVSSAAANRNFATTTLHTSIICARCSAVNVGEVCGLRS